MYQYSLSKFDFVTDNLELLSWAIQLSIPEDELNYVPVETLDQKAEDVATLTGLINSGQIGSLKVILCR